MGHEIREYDIPDRLLRVTNTQSRTGMRKDMGEAKVTHTIFGRAKVRVIREQDKIRRTWLLAALAALALAAVVWQGWIVLQRAGLLQSADSPSSRETVQVSPPAFQPEYIPPSATPQSARSIPRTLLQTEIDSLVATPKSALQQPLGMKATEKISAKPVTAQPLGKPQTTSLATNNNSSDNQTDMQQLPRLSAPIQSAAPAAATPPAAKPAANKPAAVAPLVAPSIKEDTSTLPPAGDNPPTGPVKAQP